MFADHKLLLKSSLLAFAVIPTFQSCWLLQLITLELDQF